MQAFTRIEGVAAPLRRANVDTDAIIAVQRLTGLTREGLGAHLFGGWRYDAAGNEDPDFVLNRPETKGAVILVAGPNYGCGSSREHAVWAHLGYGIRVVIAPSFASIFYENCFKNGLLPVSLPPHQVEHLLTELEGRPGARMQVDLENSVVVGPDGSHHPFTVEPSRREALLLGADPIDLTLSREAEIAAFQEADRSRRPWVWPA